MNYYSEYRWIFIGSFCALLISSHQEGLWSVINDISSFLQIFQSLSEGRLDVPWVLHYHFHFSQAFICLVNHFQTYVWWSFWSSPWEVMPWSITSGVSSLVSRGWINFFHLPSFRELLCIVRCQNMSGKKISDQPMWSKVFFQCWKGLCAHRKLGIHVEGSERSSVGGRMWQTKPGIDRGGTRGRKLLHCTGGLSVRPPLGSVTSLESKTNRALAHTITTNVISCFCSVHVKASDNLADWRNSFWFVNFRLTSRPQDVCLGSDEGNVRPADGHPKKRWVIKYLKLEVVPHFKMNVVFKQIKSLSNVNFSGMTFNSCNLFLAFKTLYFHFCSYRIQLCATHESLFF